MKRTGRDVEKKVFANALGKALQHKTITYDNKTIVFNWWMFDPDAIKVNKFYVQIASSFAISFKWFFRSVLSL